MRIIVLTKNYGDGYTGATSSTVALVREWVQKGVEVEVITQHIVGNFNEGIILHECRTKREMIKQLKISCDFPLCVGYSDDHLGFFFNFVRTRYIHTYHGNWPIAMWHGGLKGFLAGLWFIPQYAVTIKFSECVCNVSDFMRRKFTDKFNRNSVVIRNGVSIKSKGVLEKEIYKAPLRIIMVGGVDKRKYEKLLRVLEKLNRSIMDKISIDIYGTIHDRRLARDIDASDSVTFKGFANHVPYPRYDLLLTTSTVENLPISVIESIVSGVPVVAFDVGGIGEAISSGNQGVLIQRFDYKQMALTIEDIVNGNVTFRFDNRKIIDTYNWGNSSSKYLKIMNVVSKK
ncbi:glycosyltransferase family 4 protein [Levilactobacillus namurensis]|uniref:glycosyltransferase family 4 protein n=1 Tax=Levilactobacillus namurensis TaxID=380393 RepID=UPI0026F2C8BA|nr:glycosyltransferase family 4 protein [Levilactobacillus namurensis]